MSTAAAETLRAHSALPASAWRRCLLPCGSKLLAKARHVLYLHLVQALQPELYASCCCTDPDPSSVLVSYNGLLQG